MIIVEPDRDAKQLTDTVMHDSYWLLIGAAVFIGSMLAIASHVQTREQYVSAPCLYRPVIQRQVCITSSVLPNICVSLSAGVEG